MQISVEQTSSLGRKLTIVLPNNRVDDAFNSRLGELAKGAKLDGFRKGKVPMRVLKMRYGAALRDEVVGDLVKSSLEDALKQEDIRAAGMPKLEITKKNEGEDLEYVAEIEVYPEISLGDLSTIQIEKETAAFTPAHVDKRIDALREQFKEWAEADRASQNGDKIVIDFVGSIDGVEFQGGSAEGFELELGSNSMIPGFEEGLLNAKAGDAIDLNVKFPDDYPAGELAGKDSLFKVTVHKVLEGKLPELTDEFVEKLNVKDGVEGLRKQINEVMQTELNNVLRNRVKTQVLDKLLEANPIELPQTLVDQEVKQLQLQALQDIKQRLERMSDVAEVPNLTDQNFTAEAEKRIRLGLLLSEIIEKFEIRLDDERLRAKVDEIASLYDDPDHVRGMILGDKNRITELEALVMEEQVADKLLDSMQVAEKTVDYDELLSN